MHQTPIANRLHIGLFGRRNAGKSSLLNALTGQNVAIVSAEPGTTTDPVEKAMELLPLGPVLLVDTAGIDDTSSLGSQRVQKTRLIIERTDVGVIVVAAADYGACEEELLQSLRRRGAAVVVVFNKSDLAKPPPALLRTLAQQGVPCAEIALTAPSKDHAVAAVRQLLIDCAAQREPEPRLLSDLLAPGDWVVLVVPIDQQAPKGRLILPQAQAIRDLLEHDNPCVVVQEHNLAAALRGLRRPPKLVVTDSQAFAAVAAATPAEIALTSFSILLARHRGDLDTLVQGALALEHLKSGSHILVAESCTHHPGGDDIGRQKIPHLLRQRVGGELRFTHVQGHDFPADGAALATYDLVVHCGGCMFNRRAMLERIARCQEARVPVTNYGLVIAHSLGLFARALAPFFSRAGSLAPC